MLGIVPSALRFMTSEARLVNGARQTFITARDILREQTLKKKKNKQTFLNINLSLTARITVTFQRAVRVFFFFIVSISVTE